MSRLCREDAIVCKRSNRDTHNSTHPTSQTGASCATVSNACLTKKRVILDAAANPYLPSSLTLPLASLSLTLFFIFIFIVFFVATVFRTPQAEPRFLVEECTPHDRDRSWPSP
jgi:hypothetical protein